LEKYGLTLLGLTGGDIHERRSFCAQMRQKPKFFYIQDYEPITLGAAIASGSPIAVHPIQYSRACT